MRSKYYRPTSGPLLEERNITTKSAAKNFQQSSQIQGNYQDRVSKSIELDTNLVQRALRTFSMSDPITNREQGSVIQPSQASRITDSAQASEEYNTKGLEKIEDKTKQKPRKIASKSNLDAEFGDDADKPLTRARAKILASQKSQNNEQNSLAPRAEIVSQSHAPSGSSLIIKRIKD